MAPRVLVMEPGFRLEGIEQVRAPDAEAAVGLLQREWFDAVILDLRREPLDGWCVLSAIGCWPARPRLVAIVGERRDIARAKSLGADRCTVAGTRLNLRALHAACQPHPESNSPNPTPSGARA